jgi:hypothetical protein
MIRIVRLRLRPRGDNGGDRSRCTALHQLTPVQSQILHSRRDVVKYAIIVPEMTELGRRALTHVSPHDDAA